MPIAVACPGCKAKYAAPDKFAGQRMKCKACGAVLSVPAPEPEPVEDEPVPLDDEPAPPPRAASSRLGDLLDEAMPAATTITCPECNEELEAGTKKCTLCGHVIVVKKKSTSGHGGDEDDDKPKKKKKKKKKSGGLSGMIPVFCIVAFSIDILFCGWRGFIAFPNFAVMSHPDIQKIGLVFVVATWLGLITAVLGLVADVGMFVKQPWAAAVGYIAVSAAAMQMASSAGVEYIVYQGIRESSATDGFFYGILLFSLLIRAGYLAFYGSAVSQFQDWVSTAK